jgi:aspartate 1-decarboxylase
MQPCILAMPAALSDAVGRARMQRTMLGGKIHRATVTQADLHYVGSITIDAELMASAGIVEGEQVHVVDITNGARLVTYVITGAGGSGVIGINGAAAHLISPGDLVIVMSYLQLDEADRAGHRPRVVHVDSANRIVALGCDPAEPVPGAVGQASGA